MGNTHEAASDAPTILTVGEVAKRFRLSISTIYKYVETGELDCIRFGRSIRFDLDVLNAWVQRQSLRPNE